MKPTLLPNVPSLLTASLLALVATQSRSDGADFVRADNANLLNTTNAWINAATPGTNDVTVWDATCTTPANNTNGFGANVNWGGIRISNPPVPVTFTNDTANNRQIILRAAAGINITASQDMIVGCTLNNNTASTWTIGAGRFLTLQDGRNSVMNNNVTLAGAGTLVLQRTFNIQSNATVTIPAGFTIIGSTNSLVVGDAVMNVGNNNPGGHVVQNGGTVTLQRLAAGNVLVIGNQDLAPSPSSYDLNGGVLDTGNGGGGGVGTALVSGASNATASMNVTGTAQWTAGIITMSSVNGGISTMTLSGNSATTTSNLNVGSRGPATLHITNSASLTVTNTFQLADSASGTNGPLGYGTAFLSGGTLTLGTISRGAGFPANTATINFNGGLLVNRTNTAGMIAANVVVNVLEGAARIDTAGWGVTNNRALQHGSGANPDGGLAKSGAGHFATLGTNTYSGATIVSNGTLTVATVHSGGGSFAVKDGAALGVRFNTNIPTLNSSSLTLGDSTGATLNVETVTNGNPVLPLIVATNLTTAGTVTINVSGTGIGLSVGTFTIVDYSGAIGGAGFPAFTLGSLPPGVSADLVDNTLNSRVDLQVTGVPRLLTWNGDVNDVWDIGGTANWLDQTLSSTAYAEGDSLTFDDSATGTTAIMLNSLVSPGSLTMDFTHSTLDYSITGSGAIIGGVGLNKTGTSKLTMGTTNNYTGPTVISAGTFALANNNVIPDGAGRGSLTLDGALDLAGFNEAVNGFSGTGTVDNSAATPVEFIIGSNNIAGLFTGSIQNSGGGALTLIKVGSQTNALFGASSYTGGTIQRGTGPLVVTNGSALGSPSGPLTLNAVLMTFGNITNTAPTFTLIGNATISNFNNAVVSISGNILSTNNNNLTKQGDGELVLTGNGFFGALRPVHGMVRVIGGSITNGGANDIGVNAGANGTMILNGSKMYATNDGLDFNVGQNTTATGTLHVTNGAELHFADFWVGRANSATGAVYQSSGIVTNVDPGNTDIRFAGNDDATHSNTVGNYFLSGGRFDVIKNLSIGANGRGLLRITGGVANSWDGTVSLGKYANSFGTLEVLGGQFNQLTNAFNLIVGDAGTGTLLVSNAGVLSLAGNLQLGFQSNGIGTVKLATGGLIRAPRVVDGTNDSTFYFAGGTLEATASSTDYFRNLSNVLVTAAGANINSGTNNITINDAMQEDPSSSGGGLTKTGTGTLTLAGTNTYLGNTTVSAGKLYLVPTYSGQSSITVVNGAGFGARRTAANLTAVADTVTLGSAGATTLDVDVGNFGNSANPALQVANFTANGTVTLNVAGGNLTPDTIKLVDYDTAIGGDGYAAFVLGLIPRGVTATLVDNMEDTSIDLLITATTPVYWTGATDSNWNINTTTNWLLSLAPTVYLENDPLVFDDSATGSTAVNLVTNVAPSSMIVSNPVKTYTLSGPGRVTGATGLTKLGSGLLVLATSNDYIGTTLISAGTLRLGTNEALPNATGRSNVVVNGTLDVNGFIDNIMGLDGTGVVDNTAASNANLIIGANNASGSFSGVIQDTGGDLLLTKNGTGTNVLNSASTWSGGTLINNGRLSFGHNNALGSGPVTFDPGGTLATLGTRTLANTLLGTTNTGTANLNTDGGNLTVTGTVNWSGPELAKQGANTLTFAASAVVTLGTVSGFDASGGSVIIDGATFTLADDGFRLRGTTNFPIIEATVQNNATLIVGGGGVLNLGATANTNFSVVSFTNILNIISGQVMTGTGSIALGNTVANAGIVNQNGGTVGSTNSANVNGLILGNTTNSSGVYNLNAGSLTVSRIRKNGTNNAFGSFRFGGGTLRALNGSNGAVFISGLDEVLVRSAGATIDSDAFDLAVANPLTEDPSSTGGGFVKLGVGSLALNGTNTFTGTTTVSNGLLRGTGVLPTAVTVTASGRIGGGGTGTNVGTLTINSSCTATGGATMRVNKAGVTLSSDKVSVSGTLTLGGVLTVMTQGNDLVEGDSFDLFDAGTFMGNFTSYNLAALPPGLSWDARDVHLNGLIKVVKTTKVDTLAYNVGASTLTLTGSRGEPNANYRVLSSDTMTIPINLWTEVTNGTFNGSGNFSLPIIVTPAEVKRFYVLIYP